MAETEHREITGQASGKVKTLPPQRVVERDFPSLNFDLPTLTKDQGTDWHLEPCPGADNVFLKPLSFPEPETKDMSHFLYPAKDVPIVCLMPTCHEIFGGVSNKNQRQGQGQCEEKPKECEVVNSKDVECESAKSERVNPRTPDSAGAGSSDEGVKVKTGKLQFGPKDEWLRHLFLSHKMVIDKVSEISSLKRLN